MGRKGGGDVGIYWWPQFGGCVCKDYWVCTHVTASFSRAGLNTCDRSQYVSTSFFRILRIGRVVARLFRVLRVSGFRGGRTCMRDAYCISGRADVDMFPKQACTPRPTRHQRHTRTAQIGRLARFFESLNKLISTTWLAMPYVVNITGVGGWLRA